MHKVKDKFELHLDEMIQKVQACQEQNHKSCAYANTILVVNYETSISKPFTTVCQKGETGGFEF